MGKPHAPVWCIETKGDDAEVMGQARAVVTPEGRRDFQQEYLTHLRAQLTDPRVVPLLEQVIARAETRGRAKTEGASIKNWPLVGEAVWMAYEILWPIYVQASKNQLQPAADPIQEDPPAYPQVLLDHIAKLFNTEFPECLGDLTARDVLSRVQYRKLATPALTSS